MTVAALASSVQYTENGVTLDFGVPFRFSDGTILAARRLPDGSAVELVQGVDFSLTGGETDAGGTLTLNATIDGAQLSIWRSTDLAQDAHYTVSDMFPAKSHEAALDRQMMIAQEHADELSRAVKIPLTGTTDGYIPVVRDGDWALEPSVDVQMDVINEAVDFAEAAGEQALEAAAAVIAGTFALPVLFEGQTDFTLPAVPGVRPSMDVDGVGTDAFTWSESDPTHIIFDVGRHLGAEVRAIIGQAKLIPAVAVVNVAGLAALLDPRAYTIATFAAIAVALVPAPVQAFQTLGYAMVGDGGGASYKRVSSQPNHDAKALSSGGQWWEMTDIVHNVRAFGANGTAGDGARIQRAITSALARGVRQVFAPSLPGFASYAIDQIVYNDGVRLYGDGQTQFQRIGAGMAFQSGSIPVLTGTAVTDTAKFSRQVVVASTAGLAVGDRVLLWDNDYIRVNSPMRKMFYSTIHGISGTTITLSGPALYNLTAASGARLQKVSLTKNVGYENFHLRMDPTVTPIGSNQPTSIGAAFAQEGIRLRFCERVHIRGISITDNIAAGVTVMGCYLGDIDLYVENLGSAEDDDTGLRSDGLLGGYGYGVNMRALNYCVRINVTGVHVRHAVSYTAEFSELFRWGMPWGTSINGTAIETFEAGFDTHETGDMSMFENIRIFGGRAYGLQNRCKRTLVGNIMCWGTSGPAVYHYGAGTNPNAAGDESVVNNLFAIETSLGPARAYHNNQDWSVDGAVRDQGADNIVRNAYILRPGGPLVSTNSATQRPIFQNIVGTDPCQLAPSGARYAALLNQTGADRPIIDNMLVRSDGKVIDLVRTTQTNMLALLKDIWGTGHTGQTFSNSSGVMNRYMQGGYGVRSLSIGYRVGVTIASDTINVKGLVGAMIQLTPEGGATSDTLATILGGEEGDEIKLTVGGGLSVTVSHSSIRLASGADLTINGGDIISLIYTIGAWREPK